MSLQTATEKALELEREAGPSVSYHELAEVFRKIAHDLDPADPRAEFLTWENWLYEYQLKSSPTRWHRLGFYFWSCWSNLALPGELPVAESASSASCSCWRCVC